MQKISVVLFLNSKSPVDQCKEHAYNLEPLHIIIDVSYCIIHSACLNSLLILSQCNTFSFLLNYQEGYLGQKLEG